MKKVIMWAGILALIVVLAVYYKGVTADIKAGGPFAVNLAELAQGRNPVTGNFSPYA